MVNDLESKATGRQPLTHEEAERVFACPDLVSVGVLGELARRAHHGDIVTFGQVLTVAPGVVPGDTGGAREVRISGTPESVEAACAHVRAVAAVAGALPLTGYSAADLMALAGGDHLALSELAARLREAGLTGVAFLPIDVCEDAAEIVRALTHGGLQVLRATVDRAPALADRLKLIERVSQLQTEASALRAFAPLPRIDQADTPSTGYDDVKTIAVARLACANVPSIQVDWGTYGPKLAQVAIAYGADDIDNVPAIDTLGLGRRRSPAEDIARQITAAFATPVARNGRYERAS
jgi:aminodeoxyfutalosine synthase